MTMLIFITLALVNAVIWYFFFYYLLYSIKTTINLSQAALILLILFSLGIATCPLIVHCMGMMMSMPAMMMRHA